MPNQTMPQPAVIPTNNGQQPAIPAPKAFDPSAFIAQARQSGASNTQIVQFLKSKGVNLGEPASPQPGFFGREAQSIENIPSAIGNDLNNLAKDRAGEGAAYDVPKDMQSGSDSANPTKDQLSKDVQETNSLKRGAARQQTARDTGAAKDITSAEASVPNGVLGPVFGLLPSINPITGKVGTLNQIYSSPEMQQNAQDVETNWNNLTSKHPQVGKVIANSLGIANNVLQIYAGLQGASDVAGFSKGVMDSMGGTTPEVSGGTPPPDGGTPPPSAPDGVSDMKSYQKGKQFAEMLKNGKLPSISGGGGFDNPLKSLRNKIVSKTPAAENAAADLPDTPDVTSRLAKASRAFINDPKNAGAAQTEGGKLLDEANSSLSDQIKAGQKLKDEAIDGSGYKKVDTKSTGDLFETLLNNNLGTTVEGDLSGLSGTFEQRVQQLNRAIDGVSEDGGRIGKTPFSATPGNTSLIELDKPAQKILGTVKLTLENIADGKNSAAEVSGAIKNLQNLISKYYAEGAENTPAVGVVKQVIADLDKKVAEIVPDYKAGKLMQSKAYTFQDLIKGMTGKDAVNAALDKDQPLVVTDPKSPYKGMSVQDATGVNFSQRSSIAKMFDIIEDKQNATGGSGLRVSSNPTMAAIRTLIPKIERYFNNPEALKSALDDIFVNGK